MKTNLLIDYLGYILVRCASFLFRLIPISAGLWFARRVGWLIYYINRKRRSIAYQNLKSAFGAQKNTKDIKKIIMKMYQNLVETLVEILTFPRINKKYFDKYITVEGIENVKEAKRRGKGIIFLTGHFGNWELSGIVGSVIGCPMLVLAREQKHSRLNDLLNTYREVTGCKVIKKGFAVKEILSALHNNEVIGMLVDQDAGKNGVFVDFFGRKASSAQGPISLALKTGATILPGFTIRKRGPYHKVVIDKPLDIEGAGGEAIKDGLQKFAKILESHVRKSPEQWLWVHRRWKSTPTKKILILNDGKQGHLNQSLGIAEIIQKYIEETRYKIVDINFKSKTLKNFLNLSAAFSGRQCQGCMSCLKFSLIKKSYDELIREYADIIISCGASLEGVNLLISQELGAKNIIIMKPSILSTNRFDLVIAPRHDKLKQGPNIVTTEGAPTRITDESLKNDSIKLTQQFKFEKNNKIGILIGGDNPEFKLTPKITHELIDAVIEIACQIDAEILVTTSRRTPKEAEGVLKERLGKHLRCKLLVIANEKNIPEAIAGMLGLCQIAIISCESISMISEALASSNYRFVFKLEKKKTSFLKHELFLQNLVEGGYIELVETPGLIGKVKNIWDKKPSIKKLDDSLKIREAVKKII